ncbi:MAG TPA: circularly permuted type 2 ATP-grasp protein [Thermoleophilaceae bacterium]|nr:circularly permuted type 2 ATP-grasp protein [Thermoleophilaceae bacterium]
MSRPYDEAYDEGGRPRPHYAEVLAALEEDPGGIAAESTRRLESRGVSFGADGDAFAVDPVPRILTEPEWSELQVGIAQRLRALEAFVADVYGDGRVFEAGILARDDVEASPHFEPAMRGAAPRRWIAFAGLDIVRCPDGRFRVIEDQLRMPSGLAYAVAARDTLRDLVGAPPPQADVSLAFGELALALQDAAPPGVDEPRTVLLSEGPSAAGWWEHERLARELCAPLVRLSDLEHRDGRLVAWLDGRPRAVDVVYQRTGEDRFTSVDGRPTAVGEALLGPSAAGRLAVVNAPGTGVADDKLVHPHVDELVSFYLGQEALLPSIPSRPLGAGDELDGLVVKPRGEMGGDGVVIWRDADEATRARVRAKIDSEPGGWIGQELVELSVHPTVVDGRLAPRHVDLRPYALLTDDGVRVLPAGLSRVALEEGSMVVNSGRGGGAKDTWVPAAEPGSR